MSENKTYTGKVRKSLIDKDDRIVTVHEKRTVEEYLSGTPDKGTKTYRVREIPGVIDPDNRKVVVTREKTVGDMIFGTPEQREAERRQKEAQQQADQARRQAEQAIRDEQLRAEGDRLAAEGARYVAENSPHGSWQTTGGRLDTDNTPEFRRAAAAFDYPSVPLETKKEFFAFAGRWLMADSKGYSCRRRPVEVIKRDIAQHIRYGEPYWKIDGETICHERQNESEDEEIFTAVDGNGELWSARVSIRHGFNVTHFFHVIEKNEWTPVRLTEANADYYAVRMDMTLREQKAPFTLAGWLDMSSSAREELIRKAQETWSETNKKDRDRDLEEKKRDENWAKLQKAHLICRIIAFPFLLLAVLFIYRRTPVAPILIATGLGAAIYGFGFPYELEWYLMPYMVAVFYITFVTLFGYGFIYGAACAVLGYGLPKLTYMLYDRWRIRNR